MSRVEGGRVAEEQSESLQRQFAEEQILPYETLQSGRLAIELGLCCGVALWLCLSLHLTKPPFPPLFSGGGGRRLTGLSWELNEPVIQELTQRQPSVTAGLTRKVFMTRRIGGMRLSTKCLLYQLFLITESTLGSTVERKNQFPGTQKPQLWCISLFPSRWSFSLLGILLVQAYFT